MNDTTRSHVPGILAALVALLLGACESSTRPSDGAFADDRSATRAAFEQARGRWDSLGIEDYRYDFQRSCFCAPDFRAPVQIAVRQGQVSEVVTTATGQPRSPEGYPTVDGLFATLQEALDSDAYNVQVTYDPAQGYPTSFFIDRSPQIADEELWVEAGALQPQP